MKNFYKIRIKKWQIMYFFLLLPYFELGSISILEQNGIIVFQFLGKLYTLARIAIDVYVIASFFKNKRLPHSKVAIMIIFYCCLGFVIQLFHKSDLISSSLALLNNVCLIFLYDRLLGREEEDYLRLISIFFGCLSVVGAWSILSKPYGINNSAYIDIAIWVLCAKNGNGVYFLVFLMALLLYRDKMKTRLKIKDYLITLVFLYCVILCRSANSTVCIAVVLCYMLYQRFWSEMALLINYRIILLGAGAVVVYIIAATQFPDIINNVIFTLGKDTNFTGRRILWEQAIQYFLSNPLFGAGGDIIYTLSIIKTEPHAHSMYLDSLAKSGIFPCVVFIGMIVASVNSLDKKEKVMSTTKLIFAVIFIVHMAFEDLPMPFVIVIFMLIGNKAKYKFGLLSNQSERTSKYACKQIS